NMVSLDNGGLSNNCEISGFEIMASMGSRFDTLYHNTIYTGGNNGASSNTAFSTAINYHHVTGKGSGKAYFTMRNNLLVNGRTGGDGRHYLFQNQTPDNNWTVAASDTNVLIIADPGRIGRWGNSDLDSTQWKTTGGDAHSRFYTTSQLAPAALFADATGGELSIKTGARKYVAGKGMALKTVTSDYAGTSRSTTAPTIGAYEYSVVLENTTPVITSHNGNAAVTLQVPENTTLVTTITATDADAGTVLVYSVAGGEDAAMFTVNSSTGELSFVTAPDFEQPGDANSDNAYVVMVQVSDGDSTAIQRFKIKITDANDHAPVITSYNGDAAVTLTVPENTTSVIASVKATDADKNAVLAYSLASEEDAAKFMVNSSTGELSFLVPPDYEQPGDGNGDNVYIVTVKASDGDSSATQRFKIKVRNVNDHAPVITSNDGKDTVMVQVAEDAAVVDTVTAADADGGAVIRYSIVAGDDGALFSVDAATGLLKFMTAPDYEQPLDADRNNSYTVTVQASDGDSVDTQRFEIRVTNDNDSPLIISAAMQVPENTLVITTLGVSDADVTVTMSIVPGADAGLFSLDPATGVLRFITAPDFENPGDANGDNIYEVSVRIFDGSTTTMLRLYITVSDTNGASARNTGHAAAEPETQATIVLQMEEEVSPGKRITIYPNPVTNGKLTLRIDGLGAGRYTLELFAATGQLVCRQQLNHTGKSALYPVQLPVGLARGTYVLKLAAAGLRHTEKLIVE
ncbi:MAG: cadherin domain-containing protein, partial [Chitinophagaceae bacterium]